MRYNFILLFLIHIAIPGTGSVRAFEPSDLQQRLQAIHIIRGSFSQEKFLRSLDSPLRYWGSFTLVNGEGLLWHIRFPIAHTLRITPKGVDRLAPLPPTASSPNSFKWISSHSKNRETQLFLDVLKGNMVELQKRFNLALTGQPQDWQLTLTPKSALLRQIFNKIKITGGETISKIELYETQGDYTVITFSHLTFTEQLTTEEQYAFKH
ncbi:LolA family protein [Cephaloticoccus primus]|uniref:LolA family protein n=1 Tax=Cephaloticoccus primus TaxID=1548207 RepID=UPI0008381EB4|nr:outer membrane lipoprotein carrier protein LolA [Cephaloticoccus primus]